MRLPGHGRAPDELGPAYESQLDADTRRVAGAFYTPDRAALGLAELTLGRFDGPVRVCDPAVGGGAFLLAAARVLEATGIDRQTIVTTCLFGCDLDVRAVEVTRAACRLWSGETGEPVDPGSHVAVADGLDTLPWPAGFDAVIGNPPFLNQLESITARDRDAAGRLRSRFGDGAAAYADTSTLFLLAAAELCRPGGRVGMIVPESFLSARDAGPVRRRLLEIASLDGVWIANGAVFDASVRVCAPVLTVGGSPQPKVARRQGLDFEPIEAVPLPALDGSWSPLLADLVGPPRCQPSAEGRLGELCEATAGFRDQFYGLAGFVHESEPTVDPSELDAGRPRLVTSGLIDPGACLWGRRPTRFAGRRYLAPRIDLAALRADDPKLAAWAEDRLRPKVVVATQTRVLEAAVDTAGCWYPSTPTIAVHADRTDLWRIASVLLAPPTTAWVYRRCAGGALARDAVKLAASQIAEIPLPARHDEWHEGAALLENLSQLEAVGERRDALYSFGRTMCAAYAVPGEAVLDWWHERVPVRPL